MHYKQKPKDQKRFLLAYFTIWDRIDPVRDIRLFGMDYLLYFIYEKEKRKREIGGIFMKGLKKSTIRGLMSVSAVMLAMIIPAQSIAQTRAPFINGRLGTSNYKTIKNDSDIDGTYFDSEFSSLEETVGELQNVAAEIAGEGAVLLKNEQNALPIKKDSEKVTLWGLNSNEPILGGLVASSVAVGEDTGQIPYGIEEALLEKGFSLNQEMMDFYAGSETEKYRMHSNFFDKEVTGHALTPVFWNMPVNASEYFVGEAPSSLYKEDLLATADDTVAVVVLSRDNSEASDYHPDMVNTVEGDSFERPLALSQYERDMIALAKEHSTRVIVLLNADNPMEIKELKEDEGISAILWTGAPGMYGFLGVADVLSGDLNPSGRLTDTYVSNVMSNPAMVNYGVYLYDNASTSENPVLTEANKSDWFLVETEGIYVGYKYYETRYEDTVLGVNQADAEKGATTGTAWDYADEVVYPFGYGLSYTTFEQKLEDVEVTLGGEGKATVKVTNTGDVAGKSVVELYVQAPYETEGLEKASVNLIGFEKTEVLEPGASETVTVTFDPRYMASYDQNVVKEDGTEGAWILDAGTYYFTIGNGSHEAVNNILAEKAGNTDDLFINENETVDAANTVKWELAEKDVETYSKNVQNALQDCDINNLIPDAAEYMTRADWTKGWKTVETLSPTEEMMTGLTNHTYSVQENKGEVVWGEDNGLQLADFILTDEEGNYQGVLDYNDPQWDLLMNQVTLDEAIAFVEQGGDDFENIDSIGYPRTYCNDGPVGFVYDQVGGYHIKWAESDSDEPTYVSEKDDYAKYSMAVMPTQPVVAATFNTELIEREGELLGEESLWSNDAAIMAPGLSIHRSPYCARNHEYYSEDPMLVNLMGVAVCKGASRKGLMMEPKHFAFNHQEMNRSGLSTFFTEQAGRELELRGFQGALQGNHAKGLMSAFNRIGTVFAGADEGCQIQIVRNEWGFTGWITTDMINGADYMNWKDSIYGGGGTMLANNTTYETTEWNTMTANKNKIAKDAVFQQKMKDGIKYYAYTTASSNSMNGITSGTELVYVRTWWQNLIIGMIAVFSVLTIVTALLYIRKVLAKRKEQE